MSSPNNNPQTSPTVERGRVFNGMRIPRFVPGGKLPSAFSAVDMNRLVDVINSLLNIKVLPESSGAAIFSDSNLVIDMAAFTPSTGSGGGTGNAIAPFVFHGMSTNSADCIQCYAYDPSSGTFDADALFDVALGYDVRPSKHGGEGIPNVGYVGYAYTMSVQKRIATWTGGGPEYQFITPPYIPGQVVMAVNLGLVGSGVYWGAGNNLTTPWQVVDVKAWAWDPYYSGT